MLLTLIVLVLIAVISYILLHQVRAILQIKVRENHKRIYYMTPIIIAIIMLEVGFEYGETWLHYLLFILVASSFIAIPFVSGLNQTTVYYKGNRRGITGFIPQSKPLNQLIDSQIEEDGDYFLLNLTFAEEIISLRFAKEHLEEVQQIIEKRPSLASKFHLY